MAETRKNAPLPAATAEQAERLHVFAHDIKNRLTGMWEMLRMLRGTGPLDDEREELIGFAERSYLGAQRDVEDLLDDLHVERGLSVISTEAFELGRIVQQAMGAEAYRTAKKEQQVLLSGALDAQGSGDPQLTQRILQAMISNASKFSPRGSVIQVTINTAEVATISVTDNGVGLSPADLEQVFIRYALLGTRSTDGEPQARGTLARARQWAAAQGGQLSASSAGPGHGSRFDLTVRLIL